MWGKYCRKWLGPVVLGCWGVGVLAAGGYYLGTHTAPLREQGSPSVSIQEHWRVQHFLTAGCPCSAQVTKDLLATPPAEPQEVYLLGQDDALQQALAEHGYRVTVLDHVQATEQFGIAGGPWLRVYTPNAELAYSGGYAMQRPTKLTPTRPQELVAEIMAGEQSSTLPAYGCAASGL
ncbi:MAG: hypothetical protein Q7P63_00605 [Verrucomicrobiota bacterium JB022]|nr:hypothetical protein [Verrucomicrobiota bacterium JB022]